MREIDEVRIMLLRLLSDTAQFPSALIDEILKASEFVKRHMASIKVNAYGRGLLTRYRQHSLYVIATFAPVQRERRRASVARRELSLRFASLASERRPSGTGPACGAGGEIVIEVGGLISRLCCVEVPFTKRGFRPPANQL